MNDPKYKIRKGTLFNRRMLSGAVWQERNQRICELALAFIRERDISCFHTFLPIKRNREVDTWSVIDQSVKEKRTVIVSATDFQQETMSHFHYSAELVFEEDQFGIPTPRSGRTADPALLEMILIPMLAGDKSGNRIGYGKGYYDRLLAGLSPEVLKVGLAMNPLFDHFNFAEPHDVCLDYCITPREILHVGS